MFDWQTCCNTYPIPDVNLFQKSYEVFVRFQFVFQLVQKNKWARAGRGICNLYRIQSFNMLLKTVKRFFLQILKHIWHKIKYVQPWGTDSAHRGSEAGKSSIISLLSTATFWSNPEVVSPGGNNSLVIDCDCPYNNFFSPLSLILKRI